MVPFWPAALRLDQAAAYCGLSVDTFQKVCPVRPIEFTQSTRGHRYLRASLDTWLSSLDLNESTLPPKRRFGDMLFALKPAIATNRRRRRKVQVLRNEGYAAARLDCVSLFSCGVGTRLLTARFLQKLGSHYVENCQKEDIAPS